MRALDRKFSRWPLRLCGLMLSGLPYAQPLAADAPQYCEIPATSQAEPAVESEVSPIWRVDAGSLGSIAVDAPEAPLDYDTLLLLTGASATEPADRDFGLRLRNGWLLGISYESIDTSVRIGPEVVEESVGPVYEGPMFVASWKFR